MRGKEILKTSRYKLRNFIFLDLIYVAITAIILGLDISILLINLFFNPITCNLVLIGFMLYNLIMFSKFTKESTPELWDKVKTGGYPEIVNIKWIFWGSDSEEYSVIFDEKLHIKKLIITTYILFPVNVLIMFIIIILINFII